MIIHGDCVKELSQLDANIADLIIADPPYGNVLRDSWDRWTPEAYTDFSVAWLWACRRVLKDSGSLYVWTSVGPKSIDSWYSLVTVMRQNFIVKDMIVWAKQRGRGNIRGWLYTREEVFWLVKDPKYYVWNKEHQYSTHQYDPAWVKRLKREDNPYKRATNVWTDIDEVTIEQAKTSGSRGKRTMLHPAQKPVAAMKRIILAHTQSGGLVIDPFGGSGTVALAAKLTGRNCITIEQDSTYVNIIRNRLKD